MNELYPLFARLTGRAVLVVGAGPVGTEKAASLVRSGAKVTMVAPQFSDGARALPVIHVERAFEARDVDDVFLVIAAAPSSVNATVFAAAEARQRLVIAVDDRKNGSAYAAATFERGGVTVALSSGGRAPALVAILRRALESLITHEVHDWLSLAEGLRTRWLRDGVPLPKRRSILQQAIADLPKAELSKEGLS